MFHAIILVCVCVCQYACECLYRKLRHGKEEENNNNNDGDDDYNGVAGGGGGGKVDVILAILSIRCKIKHFDNIYVLFLSGSVCVYACVLASISTRMYKTEKKRFVYRKSVRNIVVE